VISSPRSLLVSICPPVSSCLIFFGSPQALPQTTRLSRGLPRKTVGVSIGEEEGSGVSVGHRVTDLSGAAPKSLRETVTSVDLKYLLPDATGQVFGPDSLTVRAGYELYGREPVSIGGEKNSLQATTSLAIDYRLLLGEAASLQAAYRYEHVRDLVASGGVWTRE